MSDLNFKLEIESNTNPLLKAEYDYFGAALEVAVWHRQGYNRNYTPRTPEEIRPHFAITTKRGEYHDRDKRKFEIRFFMDATNSEPREVDLYYPPKPGWHNPWHGIKVRSNSKLHEEVDRDMVLLVHGALDDVSEPLYRANRAAALIQKMRDTEHHLYTLRSRLNAVQDQMNNWPYTEMQILDWAREAEELMSKPGE